MYKFKVVLLLFILSVLSMKTQAQAPSATDSISDKTSQNQAQYTAPSPGMNEFSIWTGFAFDSFSWWGKTPDTKIQTLGLRYNRKILQLRDVVFEYNFLTNLHSSYSYPDFENVNRRLSLSGMGISPLGFQVNFLAQHKVQPFINASAGLMFLNKPFPDYRGKKLNFTLGAGTGVEYMLSRSVSLSVGMKYHHLSNGDRSYINPGIDSSIFYGAITFF